MRWCEERANRNSQDLPYEEITAIAIRMSTRFYGDLKGFRQFSELTNPDHYVPVPADWHVVVADIEGSTQAIARGQYKEVNLAGAATITTILNIVQGVAVPYAFGGDGATILLPPDLLSQSYEGLAAVRAKVKLMFGLELRIGSVSLRDLYAHQAWLKVGKFELSAHVSQAVFQGTALSLAEHWVKTGNSNVIFCPGPQNEEAPNLEGLECRWNPIENRNGQMVSLLVKVMPAHAQDAWRIYEAVLQDMKRLYPDDLLACPTYASGMHLSFSPAALFKEARLRGGSHMLGRIGYLLRIYCVSAIGQYCFWRKRPLGNFDGQRYISQLVANSDYRKFDEMLRMVIDSTSQQCSALEQMLNERMRHGEIIYGLHVSSRALMTCLVFNLEGNHVHFIDGADGGYALAAQQMKRRMAELGGAYEKPE